MTQRQSGNVSTILTPDEGLVLHAFLARINEGKGISIEDQSEQRILWDIECDLEETLTALLAKNYTERLAKARAKVRDVKK